MKFIPDQIIYFMDDIMKTIEMIISQQYLLEANNILTDELMGILEKFRFEFSTTSFLQSDSVKFGEMSDAIQSDLEKYISTRKDISYFNFIEISPNTGIEKSEFHNLTCIKEAFRKEKQSQTAKQEAISESQE